MTLPLARYALGRNTFPMQRVLLATNNPGKVREFRRLLAGAPLEVVTPADLAIALDVIEDGDSYSANAIKKAKAFAEAGQCTAMADDSGIEVDALGGAPGYLSARYGGPGLDDAGRTNRLLDALKDTANGDRGARYRAVIAVAGRDGSVQTFEGLQEGTIGHQWRGERGFGYDPIFITENGRTNAELSEEEKDAISHRGRAVRAALNALLEPAPR
jgi:XTP/dITP diphosphohydrolase